GAWAATARSTAAQIALAPPTPPGSFSAPITWQEPGAGALMAHAPDAARLVPSAKTKAVSLVHTSSWLRGDGLTQSDAPLKFVLIPAPCVHSFDPPSASWHGGEHVGQSSETKDVGRALCRASVGADGAHQCVDRLRQAPVARGHRRVEGACGNVA